MVKHATFSVVLAFAGAILPTPAQHKSDNSLSAQEDVPAGKVDVKNVIKIFVAPDTPGYLVAYDYDFPRHSSVYIKGLGTAPAQGSFSYVTTDHELEFRDGPGGKILRRQALEETAVVAAKPPLLPTPNAEDFPREYQSFTWDSQKTLQERAQTRDATLL